jgi:GAF domain-containing protein
VNIEDVYDLPAGSTFGFDRSFDERTGYRTRSIISTPLVSSKGSVIGVLQLINKKRDPEKLLLTSEDVAEQVVPFDERSEQLLMTLASQAGIALENMLRLSREGAVIMPVSPPWYGNPTALSQLVSGFTDKVLHLLGEPAGEGWRASELE